MVGDDIRGWPAGEVRTDAWAPIKPDRLELTHMTLTPGLTLLGLMLVLLSIPLAFSLGPLLLGIVALAFGVRRAHRGLSDAS
jgi:hypothetical protein